MREEQKAYIEKEVHHQYHDYDTNCAGTTILCLSELLDYEVSAQTFSASIGMHGAGGYRAQCGLVEGALMFLGMYLTDRGFAREETIEACRSFGEAFEKEFGSLLCRELRPEGFQEGQPPHLCEGLTCRAISFSFRYLESYIK